MIYWLHIVNIFVSNYEVPATKSEIKKLIYTQSRQFFSSSLASYYQLLYAYVQIDHSSDFNFQLLIVHPRGRSSLTGKIVLAMIVRCVCH